ncbi:hypothetical protein GO491_08465 [Flavobacteriaceae bacterium Ap0902]|nr:hypothetical protein [Flavobacteriaceae bacterium Ap0902]
MASKENKPKGDSVEEQNKKLEQMDYPKNEDIYNQESHIPLDNQGKPEGEIDNNDTMGMGLDVPGSEYDNQMENIGEEDEENNYYSGADQD